MENREFEIDCDGIGLHAKLDFPAAEQEKYPIVLLIHCLYGQMEHRPIRLLAEHLTANGYAVLRADMYGHGKSHGRITRHHVLLWVTELIRLIDYARSLDFVSDVYLVGHSQGGASCLLAGAIMQDRIRALVMLSPALVIRQGSREGLMLGQRFDPDHLPERVGVLQSNYFRVGRLLPFTEAAEEFQKPVLIVHAKTDDAAPFACTEEILPHFSNARLYPLEEDSHNYDAHLDEVMEAVADFLASC